MNVTQKKESVPSHLATPCLAFPFLESISTVSLNLFARLSIAIREGEREGRVPTRVPCEVCGRLAVGNESNVQSFVVIRVGVLVTHFLFVICECRIQRVVEDRQHKCAPFYFQPRHENNLQ